MTLIPTLSQQILQEMDVEGVIQELQTKSRAPKSPVGPSPPDRSQSSLASSVELLPDQDTRSDVGSNSISSFSGSALDLNLGDSSQSWVDQFSASLRQGSEHQPSHIGSLDSPQGARLSDSIITANSGPSFVNDGSVHVMNLPSASSPSSLTSLFCSRKARALSRQIPVQRAKLSFGKK